MSIHTPITLIQDKTSPSNAYSLLQTYHFRNSAYLNRLQGGLHVRLQGRRVAFATWVVEFDWVVV